MTWRVAMVVSASRGNDMVITVSDLMEADDMLQRAERWLGKVFSGMGGNRLAVFGDELLEFVGKGGVMREDVYKKFRRDLGSGDIEEIFGGLVRTGELVVDRGSGKVRRGE